MKEINDNYIRFFHRGSKRYKICFYNTYSGQKKLFCMETNIAPYRVLKQNFTFVECQDLDGNPVKVFWNDEKEKRSFLRIDENTQYIHLYDDGIVITPYTWSFWAGDS